MCRFVVLVFSFLVYEQTAFSAKVDQRQTGDLNVQIDLKNLQIVGLMKGKEEYVDYDYAYDYSEMTIKPQNGINTTKKPLNVTEIVVSDNTTVASTVSAELDRTTSFVQNSSSTETLVTTTVRIEADNSSFTINNSTTPPAQDPFENTNSTSSICKKGFYRNSKGNCELKLQNPSNAIGSRRRNSSTVNSIDTNSSTYTYKLGFRNDFE